MIKLTFEQVRNYQQVSLLLYDLPPSLHIFAPMLTSLKKAQRVREILLRDREENKPGEAFRTVIQLIRKGKGLRVSQVYERLNINRQSYYNWLRHPERLTVSQVKRLASALQCDVRDLVLILYGC